ncbi:solute carrier family 2, facilitated glucose transporter member 5-like [Lytechinus variegatus]|uniref:solute carrier family 2, facilitated glucose transporter member 5-like n=1 Tax=Lytechinus variegatus TaxID=7654 RepID=UPI001BB19158|nr:solute carrier family 2, facilitated glucose transporter member 5-like [Lytechinus variegatus]
MVPQSDVSLWFWLTVCTLLIGSSLTSGYQYGVITGPSQFVKDFYNETHIYRYGSPLDEYGQAWLWATTITVFCIGRIVGAVAGAKLSHKFGRSRTLIGNSVLSIVSCILMGSSEAAGSPELLIFCRAMKGLDVGISLTIVPVYLSEISPKRRRDSICRLHQVLFTVGIVVGQIMGFFVFKGRNIWPGALGLPALIDLFQIVLLLFCPESPFWLLHVKFAEEKAAGALRQLRGEDEVEQEIQVLRDDHRSKSRIVRASAWDVIFLRDANWKMPLLMCILLRLARQLSGINAIIFYSNEIFIFAGLTDIQTGLASLAWAGFYCTATVVEYFANLSRFQRKPLLLSMYGLLTLSAIAFTLFLIFEYRVSWLSWFALVALCVFFIAFPLGSGYQNTV